MPFVPSSQRLNTNTSSQIQVTEAINPIPTTQQQMINEESNNSQNSYENNSNANNNDLEDLLLTVLDELDTVKTLLLEQGIVSQHQQNKPQPTNPPNPQNPPKQNQIEHKIVRQKTTNLKNFTFSKNLQTIGTDAFLESGIESVYFSSIDDIEISLAPVSNIIETISPPIFTFMV